MNDIVGLHELLEIMDIDDGSELEYFESMADLIEEEREVDFDALYTIFSQADVYKLVGLIKDYFEDISEIIPDEDTDFNILLENIKTNLVGLGEEMDKEEPDTIRLFTSEFSKFREWYATRKEVLCRDLEEGTYEDLTVIQAIGAIRAEKLGEGRYQMDFSNMLDYDISEYVVHL